MRAKSGFVECVNAKAITTSNIGEQFSALEIWFKIFPAGFKDCKRKMEEQLIRCNTFRRRTE